MLTLRLYWCRIGAMPTLYKERVYLRCLSVPQLVSVVYHVCLYLRYHLAAGASRVSVKTSLLMRVTIAYFFKYLNPKKAKVAIVIVEYGNAHPKGANCFFKWLTMAVKCASKFGTINAYDTAIDVVFHFFFFGRFASQMQYTRRWHV